MTDLSSMIEPSAVAHLKPWLLAISASVAQSGLRIVLVIAGGLIAVRFINLGIRHLEAIMIRAGEAGELIPGATRKRVTTLAGMLKTTALAVLWSIVIVIALDQVGLDITPILAGAGIIGLAVGFGAQNLVRDLISGFFLVLENQVRIGDVAVINGTGGLVESLTFRTIVLRDQAGVVHVFPNGTITTLANMTKDWSAYVINIGLDYREDPDRVMALMRSVSEDLRRDPVFGTKMLEAIELFGVDKFDGLSLIIQARLKTLPTEQWTVGREYQRRLKHAFEQHGVQVPSQQRGLYMEKAGAPFRVQLLRDAEPARS